MRVTVRNPGDLRTLEFIALQRKTPGPGEVEIAIDASSLNFLDVLAALHALSDAGDALLITVQDDAQHVRIWVDSRGTTE